MQSDPYAQAVQFYQARNLTEAEKILRQILTANPRHPLGLHLMGLIGFDVQRYDMAEELVRSAIKEQNNNPSFYFTLGRILNRQEKKEDSIKAYEKALELKPDFIDALNNLGTTYLSMGRVDEASSIFGRILKKDPANLNALCNTASIAHNNKLYEEALTYYQKALDIDPGKANIHFDVAHVLKALGRTEDGVLSFQKAIDLKPDYIDAYFDMGDMYREKGDLDKALSIYKKIKSIKPHEDAYAVITLIYLEQGRNIEALKEAEEAVKILPESAQNLNNTARVYDKLLAFQESLDCYRRALQLEPENADIHANIAVTLKNVGRLDEAIESLKKSLSLAPDKARAHTNLLLSMVYASSVSPEELAEASRNFEECVTKPLMRNNVFDYDKDPDRKLRIGFVSPDFRKHAVSYFLAPIFKINKDEFELFAYSNVELEDATTEQIKKEFSHWRNIKYLNDDTIADAIEADKIDILIDLAGHTAGNSLTVFARKPAPIQATWLGYPATTGMNAMDYKITDIYAEPVGMTEHLNVEKLWRLPDIFCAYNPHVKSPDVIDHPPFEDNGYITFGCFNNFTKVTDSVLEVWAKILTLVPKSKLLIEIAGVENSTYMSDVEQRFSKCGIALEHIIIIPHSRANQYILYNKVDIALDPFPCNGGTTSMDTLWMGVPFVTLAGRHFVSRMGVTILTNAGLPQLIAQNIDEYISIAVDLATDHDRLCILRKGLREKFAESPVMDQKRFATNMENALRGMWKKWISN